MRQLAFTSVLLLALTVGLGDIASTNPISQVALEGVRALLLVAIGLALLAALVSRDWPAFPRALAIPAATWLGVLVLSAFTAPVNRPDAIAALARPASGLLLVWAIASVTSTPRRWRLVCSAVALGGLLVGLGGLGQALGMPLGQPVPTGDVARISSTLSHPNVAASILELTLPLLVALALTVSAVWRLPVALAACATLIALVLTFSRAGLVAALIALALMGLVLLRRGERRPLLVLTLVTLGIAIVLGGASLRSPSIQQRLSAGLDEETQVQPSRLVFWSIALDMQRDSPWLGLGPDNYRWQFTRYSRIAGDNLGIHAHNQYLEALADTGLLGLLTLGWLLAHLLWLAFRAAHGSRERADWPWRVALLGSLAAWSVHAMVDDFERFWPTGVAFWLIAGLSLRVFEHQRAQRCEQPVGRIALADECRARAQDLVPLLRSTAQND